MINNNASIDNPKPYGTIDGMDHSTGKWRPVDAISKVRKSGIRSVRFHRDPVVRHTCARCGKGIANVTTVTFIDGNWIVLGPECINKFMDKGAPSAVKILRKLETQIATLKADRAILDLPATNRPIAIANNYDGCGWHFISNPENRNRWITIPNEGCMIYNTHFYNDVTPDNEAKVAEMLAKFEARIEAAKPKFDAYIAQLEKQYGRMIAAGWKRD
jgi:hypothetical protein